MATQASFLTYESRFGPPSAPVNVAGFIQDASKISLLPLEGRDHWDQLSQETKSAIEQECRVDDLQAPLLGVLNNPRLAAYVLKTHEYSVNVIHESADTSSKRKRKRFNLPEPSQEHPEVTALRTKLDNIKLKCWPLNLDSALFMRGPKFTDQNPFTQPKPSSGTVASVSDTATQAIITVTVHNRLPYKQGFLARNSQHAMLSSQTLGDLFDAIPCTSNEMPMEIYEDDEMVGYDLKGQKNTQGASAGAVMCIEGLAYGDGQSEEDYADKLIKHMKTVSHDAPIVKATTSMHETPISTLTLRLNEPYWLLHQGSCEHFLVVDQIRLVHQSDPRSGYPLTLQITPPLLDVCRGCNRVPAVWAIVGDIRLSESPCILCDPCWKNMGEPRDGGILVAPLAKHELGW